MLLTKLEQQLLICGYVRTNYASNIAVVLLETCRLFYNETFCHTVTYNAIPDFLSKENGEKIYSSVFKLNDISMYFILAPNGTTQEEEGFVQFMVELGKNQKNISGVVVQIEMSCILHQIDFWHTDCAVLTLENCAGWNPKRLASSNVQLFYDECKTDLNFYCHITVLEIHYEHEKVPVRINSCCHNISLKRCYEDEMPIHLDEIAERGDILYLLVHGRNLAYAIGPVPEQDNEYWLGLRMYRLPQNISRISVRSTVYVSHGNMEKPKTYTMKFQFSYLNYQTAKNILLELNDKVNSIYIKVCTRILTAWDLNDKIISKKNWLMNGIQ